jgi:DNA invertase Pin-like site-specific DNA recombinase
MSVACYTRVSALSQDPSLQRTALAKWAGGRGAEPLWFSDVFSGKTMDRPGWNELWAGIVAGRIDTLAVWKLDRLGRTCSGLSKLLSDLHLRGINFVSLTEGIDLATTGGRLMANVLASVAEFEREVRTERQMAAIAGIRERHGGKCPWGGSKPGVAKKLKPDQVRFILDAKARGEKVSSIARVVGASRQTVYRVLSWAPPGQPAEPEKRTHKAKPGGPGASRAPARLADGPPSGLAQAVAATGRFGPAGAAGRKPCGRVPAAERP